MSTLTAVILTLNEEQNLRRCVEALRWCDDLVVVDSGSTDQTNALATALGARVFTHRPERPYQISKQRNWALDECAIQTEWVLFVDADEVVTEALQREIRRRLPLHEFDAFQLAPKNLFRGQWMKRSLGYPIWHDRLLRLGKARIEGGVWEHFAPGVSVGRIGEPYLHYGSSKGFSEWLERHDRYSSWDADGVVSYLANRRSDAFGTARKVRQRALAARAWRLRPLLRFLHMYLLRRGFLDGRCALSFCLRYVVYEYMTVEKVVEKRLQAQGRPL